MLVYLTTTGVSPIVVTGTTLTFYSSPTPTTPSISKYYTECLSPASTAAQVQTAINKAIRTAGDGRNWLDPTLSANLRGVSVTQLTDTANARNGKVFRVNFLDEGTMSPLVILASPSDATTPGGCNDGMSSSMNFTASTVVASYGQRYGMTAAQAGAVNGVIQRGQFQNFRVTGDDIDTTTMSNLGYLNWNVLPEATTAVVVGYTGTAAGGRSTQGSGTTLYVTSVMSGTLSPGMTLFTTATFTAGTFGVSSKTLTVSAVSSGALVSGMAITVGTTTVTLTCATTLTALTAPGTCTMDSAQNIGDGTVFTTLSAATLTAGTKLGTYVSGGLCSAPAQVVVVAGTAGALSDTLTVASTTSSTSLSATPIDADFNGMVISGSGIVGKVTLSGCVVSSNALSYCTMSSKQKINTGTTITATAPEIATCTLSQAASIPRKTTVVTQYSQSKDTLKGYLEAVSARKVRVTRSVIGKYGVVEWTIRFISNPGQTPPGSGDVNALYVVPLTASLPTVAGVATTFSPVITELVKGSTGITGYFTVDLNHDPLGPRQVWYNEDASRLERRLNELTTIGAVHVDMYQYPNTTTGGWGGVAVADGTEGGYEWRIRFLQNPGNFNGFTFPPGSGNIDPLTVSYTAGTTIFGTGVQVVTVPYVDGSTPIDGTFTLSFQGETTEPVSYAQAPVETQFMLQSLPSIGEVDVSSQFRFMQPIPGVYVSAVKDSQVLTVEYANTDTQYPDDIRHYLSSGDLLRFGGLDASTPGAPVQSTIDGAPVLGQAVVSPDSPVFGVDSAFPTVYPGELIPSAPTTTL